MRYDPSRDLPNFAREAKTVKPSVLADMVLSKRNKKVTPQSVSMFWARHPQVYEALSAEFGENIPTEYQAVDVGVFENDAFRKVRTVEQWIKELTLRNAKPQSINKFVGMIKRVCMGLLWIDGKDAPIEKWAYKHPDRLTLKDCQDYLYELKKHDIRMREYALACRNFLTSKGQVVRSTDISGVYADAGKYGDLYVSKPKIYQILDYIKGENFEVYKACFFSYLTGARISAVLTADVAYINFDEHTITVFEKASRGKEKRREVKYLRPDIWALVSESKGRLFNIDAVTLDTLCREAYKAIIPEIEPRIKEPFHFWRHMFAQHGLRATKWNYGPVAKAGGWTVEVLEKYYGKPPAEVMAQLGQELVSQL
jgi:integrase